MKICKICQLEKNDDQFKKGYQCNSCVAERKKKWAQKNKERLALEAKIRYLENKETILEKSKQYRLENKDKINNRNKKYYDQNKNIIIEKNIEYVKNNFEKTKEYKKKWAIKNKEKIKETQKKWREENKHLIKQKHEIKMKNDPIYAITCNLRKAILKSFRELAFSKNSNTVEILGCSFKEFKTYLESKFESWMSWNNRGLYNGTFNYGWDVDHIIPLNTAKTIEDVIKLNHYTNLQPLCSKVNRDIKRNKVD